MGVIRRQSLKHVSVNLVGLVVGAASTFLVYPHVREGFGLVQILLQVGLLGLPIMSLGANTVAIRFFPKFQDKSLGHNGFLPMLLLLCGLGFLISGALAWVFWEPYMHSVEQNSPLIRQYLWMAFPMAFFYVISTILSVYSSNFKRIVVPSILLDFSQKLALPLLMIGVWQQWITLEMALWGMMLHACSVTIGMILYLRWLGEWHWKPNWAFFTPSLRKEIFTFIGFWAFGGFALLIAAKLDVFMVGSLSTVKAAGTYTIAAALAAIIELPIKSLYSASASSVAKHLADENLEELDKLYKSVSINLLVAGLLLFGGLWVSIDSIFHFFPKSQSSEMSAGIWVFFFIGLSRLVEMSTGLNNNMIYYSPHYRYSLISLSIAAVLTMTLNIILIPLIGSVGAAIATLVSISFYNCFSVWLVWLKFRLFPFTKETLLAIGLSLVAFGVAYFIPYTGVDLLDILLRGGVFALVFGFFILRLRVSLDLNTLWDMLIKRYVS
jgi:O-antigen/teichoic acid export membrane protein